MNFNNFTKRILKKFRQRIDGSTSSQTAYQTLQRGVRRYQEDNRLLNSRELSIIQANRNKLVLSAPERELIENSETAINHRTQSGRRILFIGLAVILLGISIQALWPFSTKNPAGLSPTLVVSNGNTGKAKEVPPEKLNRSPRMQTSNLPVKRERLRKLNQETAPEATFKIPPEKTPEILETPLIEFPKPTTKPTPEPESERVAGAEEKKAPAPDPIAQPEKVEKKTEKPRFTYQEVVNTAFGKVVIVQEEGKWGLTNPAGQYLLDPEYDLIKAFHPQRGLFLIERSGKRGIAQAKGNIILYPFFEQIKSYHLRESLLIVANNGKFGVYDEKEQEFAIGLEFKDICCLSDGLFGVQMNDGKWGFIDRSGSMIVPPIYDTLESSFEEGRALVKKRGRKYYIDKAGNVFPYKEAH